MSQSRPNSRPVTVAAVSDIHCRRDTARPLGNIGDRLPDLADMLILAGDLTQSGHTDELDSLLFQLDQHRGFPMISVLGNHDVDSGRSDELRARLDAAGITVLEGESTSVTVAGRCVAIAGVKGGGGGFDPYVAHPTGEAEFKAFLGLAQTAAADLDLTLSRIEADTRLVVLHYAPAIATLAGEPEQLWPFLGCSLLGDVVDRHRPALVIHGHAHCGTEVGFTPGEVAVRNVARPVLRRDLAIYSLPHFE